MRTTLQFLVSLVITVLVLNFASCGKKYQPYSIDPAFSSYVLSFNSGVISASTPLEIRLVQSVPESKAGEELSNNPFRFKPSLKGKAVWVDQQTIRFVPDEPLTPGTIYDVRFALHKLVKVPKELKTLRYNFQIMRQFVQFEFGGLQAHSPENPRWQQLNGTFRTADIADAQQIESMLTINGKKPSGINWTHSTNGRTHQFTIDSLERRSNNYPIEVEWNGKKIGTDKGEFNFKMPALDSFEVVHVRTVSTPSTKIHIYFSDPLSKLQDTDGLFRTGPASEMTTLQKGSEVQLIPGGSLTGDVELTIFSTLRNNREKQLGVHFTQKLRFMSMKPRVEIIGEGVIIPEGKDIRLAFRTVSLSAVRVRIIKIFETNMVQFLQTNQLNEGGEVKRVGRVVYNQEVQLTADNAIDYSQWNTFALELSKLIEPEPGALYRVEIGFDKTHSLYPCGEGDTEIIDPLSAETDPNETFNQPPTYWGYYDDDDYIDYSIYNWEDRDNPCKSSYYMGNDRKAVRNVLASDLALIAKSGAENTYNVVVTSISEATPLNGVSLEFRNLQNQLMQTVTSDNDGFATVQLREKPFVLIATKGKQRGYLRLDDASSLSMSMFDVDGETIRKGLKGFLYGERGVWRPGDAIFLTFILEDKFKTLPANHPVVLELYNPSGQLMSRTVSTNPVKSFYSFRLKTRNDAPTGNWQAKAIVGSAVFIRNLRIETVKPNRLKVQLSFNEKVLQAGKSSTGRLQVNWLHGAPASGKRATIEATLAGTTTSFPNFKGYNFDDPSKTAATQDITVFDGMLNAQGNAAVTTQLNYEADAPGMLAVQFKTTAFEGGGDFSTDRLIMNYAPYPAYAGIKMPVMKNSRGFDAGSTTSIPIALVDANGKPISGKVKVEIFDIYWRWWWEQSAEENLASYVSNNNSRLMQSTVVELPAGKGNYTLHLNADAAGRKLLRVTDMEGGHSTGAIFYTYNKNWWSNAGSENSGGAEMLLFSTDKESYTIGDKITVKLPVTHSGRALISIETGSRILEHFWVKPGSKGTSFSFKATAEMAPNIYIHVSYIQPYQRSNDYPIRMYGVQSVKVENPETHLKPTINMAKELKPLQTFSVKVSEKDGRPMTYTLAVVDEGLLDLTRFQSPDPWKAFYAHEALGVRTWDLYKYVTGAFSGKIAGLYSIGGDQYFDRKGKENNNRFQPVVLYSGPHQLSAGATATHQLKMPEYAGSVRVMVVAGEKDAYGSTSIEVPVRQSLMILPTVPRVVGPNETIEIPVAVFAMNPAIKSVTVEMNAGAPFRLTGPQQQIIQFSKPGEQMTYFKIQVPETTGGGTIRLTATSGKETATSSTTLNVRLPNAPAGRSELITLEPGKSWKKTIEAPGLKGTASGSFTVSSHYPVNLGQRMQYLLNYPHGCVEQIVSTSFVQLIAPELSELNQEQKARAEAQVKSCIDRLSTYQQTNGGFSYWPGSGLKADSWGTSYAGHFLLEAQSRGYQVSREILRQWQVYQTREANDWRPSRRNYHTDMEQAYRLYTLALAKQPAMSAMNLMRETADTDPVARWQLAAAYSITGKTEIAQQISHSLAVKPEAQNNYDESYGSINRDQALIAESLILAGKADQASALTQNIAAVLSSDEWLSTQSTAVMLRALAAYSGQRKSASPLIGTISIKNKTHPLNSTKMSVNYDLEFTKASSQTVGVKNNSAQPMFIQLYLQGVPGTIALEAISDNLQLQLRYSGMDGKTLDPSSLRQGTQFIAEITVKHPGIRSNYQQLALTSLFPSGWEILNSRLDEVQSGSTASDASDYQDLRDDRVYTYFSLEKGGQKTFRFLLQAAYPGRFYFPMVQCEAMYDRTVRAYSESRWVEVVR